MSELPPGWAMAPLGALGELRLGKMLDRAKNQGLTRQYLRNINVRWFGFDLSDLQNISVSPEESDALSVQDGDVFICEGGEPGRCAVWRGGANQLVFQKALHRFRSAGAMLPEVLAFRLRYEALLGTLAEAFTGTTIKHLTGESLARYEVAVPPLNEQRRIADKLDVLLAQVDACRERLDRVFAIVKRFRQAVLAAATSGRLTEDWRSKERLSGAEWRHVTFEEVCIDVTVGHVGKMLSFYRENGVPFLRSLNVKPFFLDLKDLRYIDSNFHRSLSKSTLRPGDVVVVRTGAPGQCCVIPESLPVANCSDLVIIRPGEQLKAEFAQIVINSATAQEFIRSEQVGVAQAHFNVGSMKRSPLFLPPLDEQQEIVRRVELLFSYADRLEQRIQATRARVERLTPALLAKAFRGELVPQDPNDESAAVLLERLRQSASDGETKRRPGRKSASR